MYKLLFAMIKWTKKKKLIKLMEMDGGERTLLQLSNTRRIERKLGLHEFELTNVTHDELTVEAESATDLRVPSNMIQATRRTG